MKERTSEGVVLDSRVVAIDCKGSERVKRGGSELLEYAGDHLDEKTSGEKDHPLR